MNAAIAACAASGLEVAWHGINWAECYRQVRRLQARIVKAVQEIGVVPPAPAKGL